MKNTKLQNRSNIHLYAVAAICIVLITFTLFPINFFSVPQLKVGQKSEFNIRSPYSLKVKDTLATKIKREKATESVKPIFKLDPSVTDQISLEINEISDKLRANGIKAEFLLKLIARYYRNGVIPDKISNVSKQVNFINPSTKTKSERNISSFYKLSELKTKLHDELTSLLGKTKGETAFKLILPYLRPNVFYDVDETEYLKKEIYKSVKPVLYQVRKGEVIVKKGEKVSRKQAEILKAIKDYQESKQKPSKYISTMLIILATFIVVYKLYRLISPTASSNINNIVFSFTVITLDVFMIKLFSYLAKLTLESINAPVNTDTIYIPIVTSTIFASMFITKKVATIHTIPVSVIPSLTMARPELFFIPVLLGSVFSCFDSRKYKSRNVIYKSALYAGAGIAVMQTIVLLNIYGFRPSSEFILIPLSIFGSLISGITVNGLLPVFGNVFGFTTDIVYMELINLNHPLLRKLILKAPGTYNHSVMVSTLAEAAAEAIGANSLLAKAGGLYHDIGKIKNPQAFVENQTGINIHEKLPPEKSASILKSHIDYGEELAKKYKLPKPIIDIIKQHHGTKVMEYFYKKASEMGKKIDEKTFRYPGPKPQFKEAGIVMLADTVEAAVRSMKDKNIRIPEFVHKLIMKDIEDGQLNQSGLSLREINTIEKVFNKVLSGIYHERIEYPESDKKSS